MFEASVVELTVVLVGYDTQYQYPQRFSKEGNPKNLPTEDDSLFRLISLITPLPDLEEFVLEEKAKWDFVAAVLASFESLKCHIEYRSNGPNLTQ